MAKRRRVRGVLLDFDGTLVELATDYRALRRALVETLAPHGVRIDTGSMLDGLAAALQEARDGRTSKALASAYRVVDRFEWAARSAARPIPEGRALCTTCEKRALPWAIVSNNGERIIQWCLKSFDFPAPAAILARGTTRAHKPHPSVGIKALERLGIAPEEALLVGDSEIDVKLGLALGIETWRFPRQDGPRAAIFRRLLRRLEVA